MGKCEEMTSPFGDTFPTTPDPLAKLTHFPQPGNRWVWETGAARLRIHQAGGLAGKGHS